MKAPSLGATNRWPWVLVALAVVGPARGGPEDTKDAPKNDKQAGKPREKSTKGPDWLTWDQGLFRVREKYLPVLLLFNGQTTLPEKAEAEGAREG